MAVIDPYFCSGKLCHSGSGIILHAAYAFRYFGRLFRQPYDIQLFSGIKKCFHNGFRAVGESSSVITGHHDLILFYGHGLSSQPAQSGLNFIQRDSPHSLTFRSFQKITVQPDHNDPVTENQCFRHCDQCSQRDSIHMPGEIQDRQIDHMDAGSEDDGIVCMFG